MGKIADLFVRLGLRSDEFQKGLKDAKKGADNFGGSMKGLSKMAISVWTAASAVVIKFANDAINFTQKWGDKWRETMEGAKGAYRQFVRQLSSGEGWNNLFQNMAEAYNKSKEIARALDEVFERKTSLSYQDAETEKRKSELELIMRDQSRSDAERKQAAKDIIELEKQYGLVKKDVYQQEAKANRDKFQLATGLGDTETDFLVKNYNKNKDIINQARDWYAEREAIVKRINALDANRGGDYTGRLTEEWRKAKDELKKFDDAADPTLRKIAEWTKGYDQANDELVDGMAKAEVAVINVDTEMNRSIMRANTLLGQFNKTGGKVTIEAQPEVKRLDSLDLGLNLTMPEAPIKALTELQGGLRGTDAYMQQVSAHASEMSAQLEKATAVIDDLKEAIINGLSGAMQEFTDQLFGLKDKNAGAVFQALLTPLADMAVKEGEILMASGIGLESLSTALMNPIGGGPATVAAGAALIAIGAAAKSGLAALAKGGTASTSTVSSSTSTTGASAVEAMEIHVIVDGRLKGSDIVLAGQQAQRAWGR